MSQTVRILKLDLRSNITRVSICVVIALVLASCAIFQLGISKCKSDIGKKSGFIESEKSQTNRHKSYRLYLEDGFMILSEASSFVTLNNNSSAFGSDVIGLIDSGISLKFNKPQIGSNAFERPTGGMLDLSWLLLILGGGLVLAWGFITFGPKNIDYMRFLLNFAGTRVVFAGIILSRILLITIWLGITTVVLWIQLMINGIILDIKGTGHLLLFFLVLEIALIFIFIIGSIMGTIKNRIKGGIASISLWFVLLLLWPEILNAIFYQNAISSMKPIFELKTQKLGILMDFEKKVYENIKKYPTEAERNQVLREMSDNYLNNEFKMIEALETEMIDKTEDLAKGFHFWSIFNPATFYRSVNNELGSRGYNSYINFYNHLQRLQRGFIDFYIKRIFENDPQVKPYLTADEEYIFQLQSSLPKYFIPGLILNLFYIFVVLIISYFRFTRIVFPVQKDARAFEKIVIDLKKGYKIFYTRYEDFKKQMFNVFHGKAKNITGKISIAGKNIPIGEKHDFIFMPGLDSIPPTIKAAALLTLMIGTLDISKAEANEIKGKMAVSLLNKRFGDLTIPEKAQILIEILKLKKSKLCVLDNFYLSIQFEETENEILKSLKDNWDYIIELAGTQSRTHEFFEKMSSIFFKESQYYEREIRV